MYQLESLVDTLQVSSLQMKTCSDPEPVLHSDCLSVSSKKDDLRLRSPRWNTESKDFHNNQKKGSSER